MTPKLLVSVRDRAEAREAVAGGCDILDVKEPLQGALGRADWKVIAEIVDEVRSHCDGDASTRFGLSCALGELADWSTNSLIPSNAHAAIGALDFVKLGLAHQVGRATLKSDFLSVVNAVVSASKTLNWIAVVYADWQLAEAPSPNEVVQIMDDLTSQNRVRFGGLLIDTYSKGEQRLFDFITESQLCDLRTSVAARNIPFAIAGRLQASDLPRVMTVKPDIVAVRSAVCDAGCRMNAVTQAAVAAFKSQLGSCVQSRLSCLTASRRRRRSFGF